MKKIIIKDEAKKVKLSQPKSNKVKLKDNATVVTTQVVYDGGEF